MSLSSQIMEMSESEKRVKLKYQKVMNEKTELIEKLKKKEEEH